MQAMLLKDKVAVIHGPGGAIGGAVARTFASEGAKVFLSGHKLAAVEAAAQEIAAAGGSAKAAVVDALDEDAEEQLAAFVADMANAEGVSAQWRRLARFAPVAFDPAIVTRVVTAANARGHDVMRLASDTGHDAQVLASLCPSGMILVPSQPGVSNDSARRTGPTDLAAGTDVLLDVLVDLAA